MGNLKFLWFNLIYSEIKIIQRELHKKLCSETNFVHLNALSVYVPSSLLLTRVTGNKKRLNVTVQSDVFGDYLF